MTQLQLKHPDAPAPLTDEELDDFILRGAVPMRFRGQVTCPHGVSTRYNCTSCEAEREGYPLVAITYAFGAGLLLLGGIAAITYFVK